MSYPATNFAFDALRPEHDPISALFWPRGVAVIGAGEEPGTPANVVLRNLLSHPFGGILFPVSPNRSNVLGIKSYPTVTAVSEPVDLAIVATKAPLAPAVITECISAGVRAAIIMSSGFGETGPDGLKLEMEIKSRLQGSRMRVLGPNSLGVMNPLTGLNATCVPAMARPGKVAFISQSRALCPAILDWSWREMVGFSAFVSIGSMLDISWGDLIDHFGGYERTQSIVCYMESIGNARGFLSAAREVSLTKPIIVIKAGRAETSELAAEPGAAFGSDEVLEAVFRRTGVLRVNEIGDLFYMSDVLAKQPRPRGNRLTILTNAGGAGVLASDALIANGGRLAELAPQSIEALDRVLPPNWSKRNPIDILSDADAERVAKALPIVAGDPNSDGLLVIVAPQRPDTASPIAELLQPYAKSTYKPVLASFLGGEEVTAADEILNRASIPTFPFPEMAARAFTYMWRYSYNLRGLYETPVLRGAGHPDRQAAERIVRNVSTGGRTLLTEYESKQLLAMYRIPVVETEIARSEDEAVAAAEALGFPVVLKLHSESITHKAEAGGVQLSVRNREGVRQAYRTISENIARKFGGAHFLGVTVQPMVRNENGYELIVASSIDPQFGPVLLFGAGGRLAHVFKDRALALPPLNTTLARRMMEQTKIFAALAGALTLSRATSAGNEDPAFTPVDLDGLEQVLVSFSHLVVEQPWIKEIEINPLLVAPGNLMALGARVVVHGPELKEEDLPRPAIRPYPVQYVQGWKLKNGAPVTFRPIRPEDEPLMVHFHESLSDRSVYMRYFQPLKLSQRIAHEQLCRLCFVDYDREMALVAVCKDPASGADEIAAVGRLNRLHGGNEAEFAVMVSDKFQRQGLGTELCRRMLAVAHAERIERIVATILGENVAMREICRRLGFHLAFDIEDRTVRAEIHP